MDKLKASKDQLESIRDFFFQFCDIQNLTIFFQKKKKVKFKIEKIPRGSHYFFQKNKKNSGKKDIDINTKNNYSAFELDVC
jgi:hypothetical protein